MQFQGNLQTNKIKGHSAGVELVCLWIGLDFNNDFITVPHQNDWHHLRGGWRSVQWSWVPWIHYWEQEPAETNGPDYQRNPLRTSGGPAEVFRPSCRSCGKVPPLSSCPVWGRCNSRDVGGRSMRRQRGTMRKRRRMRRVVLSGLLGCSSQSSG